MSEYPRFHHTVRDELKRTTLDHEDARAALLAQVRQAVVFFDSPPLLQDVEKGIADRLQTPPARMEKSTSDPETDFLDDYNADPRRPSAHLVYDEGPNDPTITFGVVDSDRVRDNPRVEAITYSHTGSGPDAPDTVCRTKVTIHGFAERTCYSAFERKDVSFLRSTYVPDQNGVVPPAGVFVEFTQEDPSGQVKAEIYGSVRNNAGREEWMVKGYPADRQIFPFITARMHPESTFAMVVDNSLLVPVAQTLTPTFFSKTLGEVDERVQSKMKAK